jgi:hypothetical protein
MDRRGALEPASSQTSRDTRLPNDSGNLFFPEWMAGVYPTLCPTACRAWVLVHAADDHDLMRAFEQATLEIGKTYVAAKRPKTLRARLARVELHFYVGHLIVVYWMALLLHPNEGSALIREALSATSRGDSKARRIKSDLMRLAAHRVWTAEEHRHWLLTHVVSLDEDFRCSDAIAQLGMALARQSPITTAEIQRRAELLADGGVPGPANHIHASFWIACTALLIRDRIRGLQEVNRLLARGGMRLSPDPFNNHHRSLAAVLRRL